MGKQPLIFSALVLGLILCAMPASAALQTLTYNGVTDTKINVTPGMAISSASFYLPLNTNITYSVGYGESSSLPGEFKYYAKKAEVIGFEYSVYSVSRVQIASNYSQSEFWDVAGGAVKREDIVAHYTQDGNMVGIIVYDTSLLNLHSRENYAYEPIADFANKPIYWIDVESSQPVTIDVVYGPQSEIQSELATSSTNYWQEFYDLFVGAVWSVKEVAEALLNWALFIWENRVMIIALYLAITLAYALNGTRNIFTALKRWFRFQRSLFEFIVSMWTSLLTALDAVKSIIIRWL